MRAVILSLIHVGKLFDRSLKVIYCSGELFVTVCLSMFLWQFLSESMPLDWQLHLILNLRGLFENEFLAIPTSEHAIFGKDDNKRNKFIYFVSMLKPCLVQIVFLSQSKQTEWHELICLRNWLCICLFNCWNGNGFISVLVWVSVNIFLSSDMAVSEFYCSCVHMHVLSVTTFQLSALKEKEAMPS